MEMTVNIKPTTAHNFVIGKQKMCLDSNKLRKVGSIIAIIAFVLIFIIPVSVIWEDFNEITSSSEISAFVVPFNINLQGETGFVETDVSISLNFTFPSGILIVGDPVEISGTAVLFSDEAINISRISVGFQNCYEYPLNFSKWDLPKQGFIHFLNEPPYYAGMGIDEETGRIVMYMNSESNVTWSNEGDSKPIIYIVFSNGTKQTMTSEASVLHVNPKEQFTEIQSIKVDLILSFAVFVFSSFGLFNIVSDLWPDKQKEELTKAISELNSNGKKQHKALLKSLESQEKLLKQMQKDQKAKKKKS